jgi:hypothetical protein
LGDVGRQHEGLAAIQEAVRIRRALAKANPDAYLPDLANSLNHLSLRFGEVGRLDEGLSTVTEAVGILRALAHDSPARFGVDLRQSTEAMNRLEALQP